LGCWGALLVVMRADVAFEEASVELPRRWRKKSRPARRQVAKWGKIKKSKRPPFQLSPLGPRPVALLWKNLIGAGQAFTMRM